MSDDDGDDDYGYSGERSDDDEIGSVLSGVIDYNDAENAEKAENEILDDKLQSALQSALLAEPNEDKRDEIREKYMILESLNKANADEDSDDNEEDNEDKGPVLSKGQELLKASLRPSLKRTLVDETSLKLSENNAIMELKKNMDEPNDVAMKRCFYEYQRDREVATDLWNTVYSRYNTDAKLSAVKYIVNCLFRIKNFKVDIIPAPPSRFRWIEDWKKTTLSGGRGIVVNLSDKLFKFTQGLNLFRDIVVTKRDKLLDSKVPRASKDEVLGPSDISVSEIVKKISGIKSYVNDVLPNTGVVLIKLDTVKVNELESIFSKMSIKGSKISTTIQNVKKVLDGKLLPSEELVLKNINGPASVDKLMNSIRKSTDDYAHDTVSSSSGKFSRAEVKYPIKGSDRKVVSTFYNSSVVFVKPYADPHFKELETKFEYWIPKVHMRTSLKVWKEKQEILRYEAMGCVVYIKPETVNIKYVEGSTDKYEEITYIRKFLSFFDYLKSWQETYVRKYKEYESDLANIISGIIMSNIVMRISNERSKVIARHTSKTDERVLNLIHYRYRLYKKINDIKDYFVDKMNDRNKEKLREYIGDEVVLVVLAIKFPDMERHIYDTFSSGEIRSAIAKYYIK